MSDQQSDFDIVSVVLGRWRWLVVGGVLGLALGVLYGVLTPNWYTARLSGVSSQRSQTAAMGLVSKLPGMEGLGAATATDVQRIQAVMTSRSVSDAVIEKFELAKRYGSDHIEKTRELLWSHCVVATERKSAVVTLECEDTDPKVAMEMAEYFGQVGNEVFGRISTSSAGEERKFLERQVAKSRADVEEASRKLREFQEQHKIVDIGEQAKAVISAMATLKGQLLSKQMQLSYVSSFSSPTESNVTQLQQQVQVLEDGLHDLEERERAAKGSAAGSAAAGSGDSGTFFPEAMDVPKLRFELEQLIRDQKVAETIFFLVTQRYETARVDEARDTSTFQILDHATLPTIKSRPKRVKTAVLGMVGGAAFGAALIVILTWARSYFRRRRRPNHPAALATQLDSAPSE